MLYVIITYSTMSEIYSVSGQLYSVDAHARFNFTPGIYGNKGYGAKGISCKRANRQSNPKYNSLTNLTKFNMYLAIYGCRKIKTHLLNNFITSI